MEQVGFNGGNKEWWWWERKERNQRASKGLWWGVCVAFVSGIIREGALLLIFFLYK